MMVNQPIINSNTVYFQTNTRNKSFLELANFLEKKGIKNNNFFLILFDPVLYNVDPHDPNLPPDLAKRVFFECSRNYWYFVREVVRVEDQGNPRGVPYRLHRGNLALNFCIMLNLNVFEELPRQFGKTIGVCVRLLWEFLFGTTNSESMLINKKHDDSKLNLKRIKNMRDLLPSYLRLEADKDDSGKRKSTGGAESLLNVVNNNLLKTKASARNKIAASSLGRGCTQPRQWYDEYAFIPFNREIYMSATPALSTASENAKRNGAPYGMIITTTPGDLTTDSGMEAFSLKELSTPFNETWYDMDANTIYKLVSKNINSTFVYIKFSYKQLGAGESYFAKMVKELRQDYAAIRREVLLEWNEASDNSPFTKEQLDTVKRLVREPIATMGLLNSMYQLNVYEPMNMKLSPPIIGVDVSGGISKDSSAITIIDSKTTRVVADFKSNCISPTDLALLLVELVSNYCPNAVVNIERNGGFGQAVIGYLKKTIIARNLYYEYKENVTEERYDGFKIIRNKVTKRVFGLNNNQNVRNELMEILRQRMDYHKDKFNSPTLYSELKTLEIKKNGRIEHTSSGHDDQVFSYLMALYVWYNGKDLRETWGIIKGSLKTDVDDTQDIVSLQDGMEDSTDISPELSALINSDVYDENSIYHQQKQFFDQNVMYTPSDWRTKQFKEDEAAMNQLLSTPIGQKAYMDKHNMTKEDLELELRQRAISSTVLNTDVMNSFYGYDMGYDNNYMQDQPKVIGNIGNLFDIDNSVNNHNLFN